MTSPFLAGVALATALVPSGSGDVSKPVGLEGVGIEQKLGAQVPMDLTLRDEAGRPVRLGDLFGGKPVVLNLVYYRCPMLCTLVVNGLLSSFRALPFHVGEEFRVVTVSIDPRETADLAAAKKRTVLAEYGRAVAEDGWRFLTGDAEAIERLAATVGFQYSYDAQTQTFAHASGIMILTPQGKVSRYFYGVEYAPRDVRLSLIEASENRIGSLADQVLLFCYRYDPKMGRYSVAALNLVRVGGILTVLSIAAYVLIARRREAARTS